MIPHDDPAFDQEIGLTKREYFAVIAMQGFISTLSTKDIDANQQYVIARSASYADALLAELEKNK